jgi:O-antigen/teichoic acid export membrane protein
MHFAQSVGFAAISLSLLSWWRLGASSIVIGYGTACLTSAAGAICWLVPALRELSKDTAGPAVPHREFWPKLLRFAFWVWIMNFLANLFAVIDRYMLVHWGNASANEALVQVGHYHSSRLVPLLLLSVADLLSSILLPYLSQDWEAGRRHAVGTRLNFVLKLTSLAAFAGGVCVLLVAPVLFGVALKGKYEGGLTVLPLTLSYCAFNGIAMVALTYLWCAERTFLSVLPMAAALIVNVVLNLVLVPHYGLAGAVIGTTIANFGCLATVYWLSHLMGMRFDSGTLVLSGLPAALVAGPEMAVPVLAVVLAAVSICPTLFNGDERKQFSEWMQELVRRLRGGVRAKCRTTSITR